MNFTTQTDGASWPVWHSSGRLTVPTEPRRDELHVLVHGAGLDHRYWDWPVEPQRYSYVAWAAQRGIATLNIDRIGCGHSSRLPGHDVTLAAQAHTLVQIIEAVRAGHQGIPTFSRVVLIGHLAAREDLGVDELRYWSAQTDPQILAFEALIKGPATKAELGDAAVAGPLIRTLNTPTLALVGQHDALLIDGTLNESDTYDTVRRVSRGIGQAFEFCVVPDSGHMLNLHRAASPDRNRLT